MKSDTLSSILKDIAVAFCLLSRVPTPTLPGTAFENTARAVWAYSIVGAVVGGLAALVGLLVVMIGLPVIFAAGLLLAALALITGAMHEDGLSDTADGFWGGNSVERRLQIMKDSQIGSYGTLALIVITGLRWVAYAALLPLGAGPIVAAAALSRAVMPIPMHFLSHARQNGLSRDVGKPEMTWVLTGLAMAFAISFFAIGPLALTAIGTSLLAAGGVCWLAARKIGGQTGDVLGATQLISETAILACLLVAAS